MILDRRGAARPVVVVFGFAVTSWGGETGREEVEGAGESAGSRSKREDSG
jgi:hypothetical protein